MADLRSDLAKARDAYFMADDGAAACDPVTLRAPEQSRQYLTNRLETAFIAGWNACLAHKPSEPNL